jgi:hypothetical protein
VPVLIQQLLPLELLVLLLPVLFDSHVLLLLLLLQLPQLPLLRLRSLALLALRCFHSL